MLFLSIISTAYHLLSGSRAARLLLNWLDSNSSASSCLGFYSAKATLLAFCLGSLYLIFFSPRWLQLHLHSTTMSYDASMVLLSSIYLFCCRPQCPFHHIPLLSTLSFTNTSFCCLLPPEQIPALHSVPSTSTLTALSCAFSLILSYVCLHDRTL